MTIPPPLSKPDPREALTRTKRLTLTDHAISRIADRRLDAALIESVVREPLGRGAMRDRARFATSAVLIGPKREWVTVVYVEETDELVVLTAYVERPTGSESPMRRAAGSKRAMRRRGSRRAASRSKREA